MHNEPREAAVTAMPPEAADSLGEVEAEADAEVQTVEAAAEVAAEVAGNFEDKQGRVELAGRKNHTG